MKKVFALLSGLILVFSMSLISACKKSDLPEADTPPPIIDTGNETQDKTHTPPPIIDTGNKTQDKSVEVKIADTEHCQMSIDNAKESYVQQDKLYFSYELDDGYALEYVKVENETEKGEIQVYQFEFKVGNIFEYFLFYGLKKVTFTPVVTDNVDLADEIRIESKYGGNGTAKWMFDYVPKGVDRNWMIVEPDENSYVKSIRSYELYSNPPDLGGGAVVGGFISRHDPNEYNCRSVQSVSLGAKTAENRDFPVADEIYTEVVFISKQNAAVLKFACKNDFERNESDGAFAAFLSTRIVVCEKGEIYYHNFYFENNYNAIIKNGYEFVGWTDEEGKVVCDTLEGEFSAEKDATFYITFRDLYEQTE